MTKAAIAGLSERLDLPAENLMTPEHVRRLLWRPPRPATLEAVDRAFADLGARPWQRELISPLVVAAVEEHP